MNCPFCKIIKGEIPSYSLYEDEIAQVFLDINPDTNGHLLIIPKKHILNLFDIDNETLVHIMDLARQQGILLKEKLKIDGLTLIQNNGLIQEVKHYHLHLKPYYKEKQEIIPVKDIYNLLTK